MMDRNLGATSAKPGDVGALGLLYQWGRKDPFLGSSSISDNIKAVSTLSWPSPATSDSSIGTIAYAVEHPTTFICGGNRPRDWVYSHDNMLWQSTKTIYDPCPSGWRVPDGGIGGVWSKSLDSYCTYDSTNKGVNFSGMFGSASTIWYPAVGSLSEEDGSLNYVGDMGDWWSCTPSNSSSYANVLFFSLSRSEVAYSNSVGARARGYSVRCLKEE